METQTAARLLNPFVFHLEKLGLELKCPLCLNLLDKPILLPCSHIFCNTCIPKSRQFSSECPTCQHRFTDREIRPASHMENISTIYKSLKATFNSTILPLLSSSTRASVPLLACIEQLQKNPPEMKTECGIEHASSALVGYVEGQITSIMKTGTSEVLNNSQRKQGSCPSKENVTSSPLLEELDVNQTPESSPGSSPSFGRDSAGHNRNQGHKNGSTEISSDERYIRSSLETALDAMDNRAYSEDIFHPREPKRLKRLNCEFSKPVIQNHGCHQKRVSNPNEAAVSNNNVDNRSEDKTSIIPLTAASDVSDFNASICAFCHSSIITEDTGPMVHYAKGKEVTRSETTFSTAIPVHRTCIDWTPKVYYSGDRIKNLESELARASKLKCSSCGLNGAALGCLIKSCRKTYHFPCALKISECRWDCDNFLMLCPLHKSTKFPSEKFSSGNQYSGDDHSLTIQKESKSSNFWETSPNKPQEWVFCGSALSSEEKFLMVKFGKICGASVFKFWDPSVTHVIAATNADGACSRTLKVLMAILNGRWVLNIDWVKACVEANSPVNEEPYEVNLDNHGFRDGPRTGRLRASSNAPKLFSGLSFYFSGAFVPAYKSDLSDLVTAGGGTIIEKIEQIQVVSSNFVVYIRDLPQAFMSEAADSSVLKRLEDAKDVAKRINAQVIPHTWILESIAACSVLPPPLC